jgi:uncharacterized membrane protein
MKISGHAEKRLMFAILIFFSLLYGSISLVNHYFLRTWALDLGMFNHAIYAMSRFIKPVFTLGIDGNEMHFLGTHFSPITWLYAPLVYIFGSYTLLILQIAVIISGGIAAYRFAKLKFKKKSPLPLILLAHFYCIWGIYSALSFDFHNNVIGAMLIIWFIYFLEVRKFLYAGILLSLAMLSHEAVALWSVFVLAGLLLMNRGESRKDSREFLTWALLISLAYTILVLLLVMPLIQMQDHNLQFSRYGHLGSNAWEILKNLVIHPKHTFSLLFESNVYEEIAFGIKSELHFMVLISGGFVFFFRPWFLFMLIPVYALKLFSSDYGFWGINNQYSIEFVPVLSVALTVFLSGLKSSRTATLVASLTLAATVTFTLTTMESRRSKWYNKTNTAFYSKSHYSTDYDLKEVKKTIASIPHDAIVSVSSALAPRMAQREKIYHFPVIKDAGYILLLTSGSSTYPLSEADFAGKVKELKNNPEFEVIYEKNHLLILRRSP